MPAPVTIVVAGDELIAGVGDPRGLGWTGRVQARTVEAVPDARLFTLAVPGETTHGLAKRAMREAALRFDPDGRNLLVLAPGIGDVREQVTLARSRLNLANVLDAALGREVSTLVVGPPPTGDPGLDERIEQLAGGFADVAVRRGVPFVDAFHPLRAHEAWLTDIRREPAGVPGQEGYGLLAWLVLHRGWYSWIGVEPPEA